MRGKVYAEKVLIVDVDQVTPLHFHWVKMEDIINRGGGKLVVQLYNCTPDDALDDTDVTVSVDGGRRVLKAGDSVVLGPGESMGQHRQSTTRSSRSLPTRPRSRLRSKEFIVGSRFCHHARSALRCERHAQMNVANRYIGAFEDEESKVRGTEARRRDTPPFIAAAQMAMLKRIQSPT